MSQHRNIELEGRISILEGGRKIPNYTHSEMLEAKLKMDTESKKTLQAQIAFSEQVRKA